MPNTGYYDWYIPRDERLVSDICRIRVVAIEQETTSGFRPQRGEGISARFCLDLPPSPLVKILNYIECRELLAGQTQPISFDVIWLEQANKNLINICAHYSMDGENCWIPIAKKLLFCEVVGWKIPDHIQPGDTGLLRVIAEAPANLVGEDTITIRFVSPNDEKW